MRVYETARRHPGRTGDITGIVLLERGLGGAGTVLLGAIGFMLAVGHYDVGAYLWLEGSSCSARSCSCSSSSRARRGRCSRARSRCSAAFASSARSARSTTGSTTSAVTSGCSPPCSSSRRRSRRCGSSRSGPAAGPSGSSSGPRIYYVMGPALLPRPARPVHAQRHRRAGGVLRQLPRQRRRRRRRRVRCRVPLLPRHDGPRRCPARRSSCGKGSAAARGRDSSMADAARVACVVVTHDALQWIERCLESVAGTETVVVDNGSTDGTVGFVRSDVPVGSRDRGREPRARGRLEPRHRGDVDPSSCWCSTPMRGSSRTRWTVSSTRRTAHPGAAVARAEAAQPGRKRSSAPFAVSRPSGDSRPSTSTCGSSRRRPAR